MGWFSNEDEIKETGNTFTKVTSGLRQLFTGDIPPEIVAEMDRLDTEAITERWKADATMPWWKSSRSIVMLWLNINVIVLMWLDGATRFTMNEVVMTSLLGTLALVNTAFFGSKGIEYIKAGKAP